MVKRISKRTCTVNGCDRLVEGFGLCRPHLERTRKYGDPGPAEVAVKIRRGPVCTVEGCTGRHRRLGLCGKHYWRLRTYGDPLAQPKLPYDPECAIEGCEKPSRSRGMCEMHYTRWLKYGDPLVVRPNRAADEDITYFSFHARIRRSRGKASDYQCVRCEKRAKDWAHIHLTNPRDIQNYMPMCHHCHMLYDYEDIMAKTKRTIAQRKARD